MTTAPLRSGALQFARFSVVGGLGYVVNLVVFAALIRLTPVAPLAAACVAFAAGWVLALGGHRRWTFRRGDAPLRTQGTRYLIVSAITLGIDLGLLHALISWGVGPVAAQAVALGTATPASFVLNRNWSFR